ncbi:MAG: hypothetical protein D6751_06535 [Deltaproteobacteria bacterium]|nr:MAG: hypothetical protein D6751_06535 [Deltaproteobacteria bacterium]
MNRSSALFAVCFTAGALGALVNSLAAHYAGSLGLFGLIGVKLHPPLALAWLYPRLVWGGLWGLVYFFTIGRVRTRRHWVRKGLWVSLLPTAVQLTIVFPNFTSHGMFGLGLGTLTPLAVLLLNGIWGLFTGIFTRAFWGRG